MYVIMYIMLYIQSVPRNMHLLAVHFLNHYYKDILKIGSVVLPVLCAPDRMIWAYCFCPVPP